MCSCGYSTECGMHCGNGHQTGACSQPMREYISPFKLPTDVGECSWEKVKHKKNVASYDVPYNPKEFGALHARNGNCPVHVPRSGAQKEEYDRWQNWYANRENFANADNEDDARAFYSHMLLAVTATNPPEKPIVWEKPEVVRERSDAMTEFIVAVLFVTFFLGLVGLLGLIGAL